MKLTIPNILTLFRFALVPIFVWVFLETNPIFALPVFILACVTDILDGYIARKTNTTSTFGKWADPLADKTMTITVLACLTAFHHLPWFFLVFFSAKEILMVIGGLIVYFGKGKQKKIYGSKPIGKLAMVTTFIGLIFAFFKDQTAPWHIAIMWISVGVSIASIMYYYLYHYKGIIED